LTDDVKIKDIKLPEWKEGYDREALVKMTAVDEGLKQWIDLADKGYEGADGRMSN